MLSIMFTFCISTFQISDILAWKPRDEQMVNAVFTGKSTFWQQHKLCPATWVGIGHKLQTTASHCH